MEQTEPVEVEVDWEQARSANQANWDDRAAVHEPSYGFERFASDPDHISPVVADDLPVLLQHLPSSSLAGLDLLHLQCHLGTDTVSFARLGARVTGLDFSAASLAGARRLAASAGVETTWVQADALEARTHISGDFDVVYTSIGALCWLADLDRWAEQVAALLRPGGVFYVRDGHPMLYALDENAPDLKVARRYFATGKAQQWDDEGSYTGEGTVSHPRSYEWPHPISEVIGALLGAGLVLERFDEGRTLPWQFSSRMVPDPDGHGWGWPGDEADRVPCTFTVVARRPH